MASVIDPIEALSTNDDHRDPQKVGENLVAYRKRSAMTIVGIVWGIASFILLIAYGNGFEKAMMLA